MPLDEPESDQPGKPDFVSSAAVSAPHSCSDADEEVSDEEDEDEEDLSATRRMLGAEAEALLHGMLDSASLTVDQQQRVLTALETQAQLAAETASYGNPSDDDSEDESCDEGCEEAAGPAEGPAAEGAAAAAAAGADDMSEVGNLMNVCTCQGLYLRTTYCISQNTVESMR
jgi:hypothetical protein